LDIPQKKNRAVHYSQYYIRVHYLQYYPQISIHRNVALYCDFNVTSIIIPSQNRTGPY